MKVLSLFPLLAASALAAPIEVMDVRELASRQSTDKLVFCHFMIGIVADRTSAADYDDDMKRAKEIGIDAFALNIGTDDYTTQQLDYAYESAANNGMNVFISFDFNWYDPASSASTIGGMIATYGVKDAQLMVDGKALMSSFAGDGLDVAAMKSAAGIDVAFMPNFHPGTGDFSQLDGALNWMGWPSNGQNKVPDGLGNVTVIEGDDNYRNTLGDLPLIAPASPWFFTHYGPEVTYSKNFVFPGDLLWYYRWQEILSTQPNYVEIITWNDYGESHYFGPLSSKHNDDGGSKWVNDMPHDAWLTMAIPFIQAYKAGAAAPDSYITDDTIVYWYRQTKASLDCDATDTTMATADNSSGNYFNGRPYGYEQLADDVFAVTLLTAAGTLEINSGGTVYTTDMPAGAAAVQVPFNVGTQAFSLTRDGSSVLSDVSLKAIVDTCVCGIYNFNAYTGSVPAQDYDVLDTDGLAKLTDGLIASCDPTPSLPATPPATQAPTTTISVAMAPTGLQV